MFSYVQCPEATQEGEYVTALNYLKETALRQMILTKKRYGKTDGYIAWHGYQSFKPEEVTPQLAHETGVKLAKEMWGDRFEIIVTTHLDKEHIHCHFCFNSVSFRDGWMRKTASLLATMSTVPMFGRPWTSAARLTIWRIICGARGISPTSPVSTGRYACPNMSISQDWIH